MRQISARFLSQEERIEIADLHHAGLSIRQIAHRLFLLIITMGVLAAYCGPVSPGYGAVCCFPVIALGQRLIPDGDHHRVRLDRRDCGTPRKAPTVTARSISGVASQP